MSGSEQLFVVLLFAGLMLFGAEVFVPGGILGVMGGICLLGAIISAFSAFGPTAGAYIAAGIFVLLGIVIALWIKVFPKTGIGKAMTVSRDLSDSSAASSGIHDLMDQEGEAISDLRPAGFARINSKRIDVVTQGEMIEKGTLVKVIATRGNFVVVKSLKNEK
ncbi:MAG: hypothetical protein JXN60_05595 [Lentisphaerae bacterium]|nr:hypothetical protein [Lentisphaerota bacterium]